MKALRPVTCSRCGRKGAAITMYKSITKPGAFICRNRKGCNRRRRG